MTSLLFNLTHSLPLLLHRVESNLLNQIFVLSHRLQTLAATGTATERERWKFDVCACWWVRHTKRAVYAATVLSFSPFIPALVMASFAKICSSKAVEESNWATEVAFPVDVRPGVLVTMACTSSISLQLTVLAHQAIFGNAFALLHFLLAVYHSAKVRLFAFIALIKSAWMKSQALQVSLKLISTCSEALTVIKALILCGLKSFYCDAATKLF